jgi:hypothetical protein
LGTGIYEIKSCVFEDKKDVINQIKDGKIGLI